jgi:hypothetical protein
MFRCVRGRYVSGRWRHTVQGEGEGGRERESERERERGREREREREIAPRSARASTHGHTAAARTEPHQYFGGQKTRPSLTNR